MIDVLAQRPTEWEKSLHERASLEARCEEFGDPEYLVGLRSLLQSYERMPVLSSLTRMRLFRLLVSVLVSRLHSEHQWKQNPEVLKTDLRAPIVITGLPRSGTTAMHKLLSLDPQFQGLENWLTSTPRTRPSKDLWDKDADYRAAVVRHRLLYSEVPELRKVHEVAPAEVEECRRLLAQNFCSNLFGSMSTVPGYDDWFLAADATSSFKRHANNLKLIGFGQDDRRWLLKDPAHMLHLRALLDTFPNARIVHMHREPFAALASISSLYAILRPTFEGPNADPTIIGPRETRVWAEGVKRIVAERKQRPASFIDVSFDDFRSDQLGCIKNLYSALQLSLTRETEDAMNSWLAANAVGKHGHHSYEPESFGLRKEQVLPLFEDYVAHFRHP